MSDISFKRHTKSTTGSRQCWKCNTGCLLCVFSPVGNRYPSKLVFFFGPTQYVEWYRVCWWKRTLLLAVQFSKLMQEMEMTNKQAKSNAHKLHSNSGVAPLEGRGLRKPRRLDRNGLAHSFLPSIFFYCMTFTDDESYCPFCSRRTCVSSFSLVVVFESTFFFQQSWQEETRGVSLSLLVVTVGSVCPGL